MASELRDATGKILADLLTRTGGSRATARVDVPEDGIDIQLPLAEALAPGIASMMQDRSIKQGTGAPSRWMREHRQTLVQPDIATHEITPPAGLVDKYGAKAQMLSPLWGGDELIGWVSVHYQPSPRDWSAEDVRAIEYAAASIMRLLDERRKADPIS